MTALAPARHPHADLPRHFHALVVCAVCMLWSLHLLAGSPVFPVDDAYITLHNAQVLRSGFDPNYAGVSALTGATSAIHLAIVAALLWLLPPLWALDTATWLAILFYVTGLLRLASVHRASATQTLLLVVLGVVVGEMPHQLLNGLETGWALAGLVWTLALASDPQPKQPWLLPLLAGQLPFLRPELIVVSMGIFGLLAWHHLDTVAGSQARRQAILRDALLLLAGAAPWLLWYLTATGLAYPSTVLAKRSFFAEGLLPAALRRAWVGDSLLRFAATLGLLSGALLLLLRSRLGLLGLIFLIAFIGAYYIQFPGALGHYEQRYLYIVVPFLLLGIAAHFSIGAPLLRRGIVLLTLLAVAQSLLNFPPHYRFHQEKLDFTRQELAALAAWCKRELPPASRLLVHDAGYIAFATSFQLIDIVGLKTPSNIPHHASLTWPSVGARRGEAIQRIALSQRPDYLVVLNSWDAIYGFTRDLSAFGWRLERVYQSPRGETGYAVYRLSPPV